MIVHQLLQVLGRKIAVEESNDHAERTRVWHDDEAYRVLAKEGVSKTFEALALDIRKLKEVTEVLALQTASLVNTDKVKFSEQTGSGYSNKFPVSNVTSHISSIASAEPCRQFSLVEMNSETKDFDDELLIGRGGFGKVYKGEVIIEKTCHVVAIKRLDSMSQQGTREFLAEIEVLSIVRHCHLVSLIGYCHDENEMILVYEYIIYPMEPYTIIYSKARLL